jgi:hypothetical protein
VESTPQLVDDVRDRSIAEGSVRNEEDASVLVRTEIEFEVVVGENQSVGVEGVLRDAVVVDSLPESGDPSDVFDVVTEFGEGIDEPAFDVLVRDDAVGHRSAVVGSREDVLATGFDGASVSLLGAVHLLGVLVVVGECLVDVGQREIVLFGDGLGFDPALDAVVDEPDGDPAPLDVGLVVDRRRLAGNDPYSCLDIPGGSRRARINLSPRGVLVYLS